MATLLKTVNGSSAKNASETNEHYVRARLYMDSDTGSGYQMHWVWDVYLVKWTAGVGRTFTRTYGGSTSTFYQKYNSVTNVAVGSVTGSQFTVAYGKSCSTTATARWSTDGGTVVSSSLSASYTVPKPTYAIKYNANGGTGAPGNQTKTYGTNLTLSSTIPTRTDYDFLGWATSASGAAQYQPGGTYSANTAATLYAVWQLNYIHPTVSDVVVDRCDANGNLSDDGGYVLTQFRYEADTTFDSTNEIASAYVTVDGTTDTVSIGQQEGTASVISTATVLETEPYDVTITVVDTFKGGTTTATTTLPVPQYIIDVAPGGDAVGFGKPADKAGYISTDFGIEVENNRVDLVAPTFPTSVPSDIFYADACRMRFFDGDGNIIGDIRPIFRSASSNNGARGIQWIARRDVGGTQKQAYIEIAVDSSGYARMYSNILGSRKTANASKTLGTGGIDAYGTGPSVSLEPGVWVVNGQVNFNTGASSGTRNIAARFKVGDSQYAEQQRVVSAANNWAALNLTILLNLTATTTTTVTLQGSSSMAYNTATTWYITAQRVG